MAIPHEVLAEGWIPFTVVLVMTLIFSWFYIRYYQDNSLSEVSSTITAIIALVIALLTSALVPVDIFLVSFMKNNDGSWKPWSSITADRNDLESLVDTSYYVLYGLLASLIFLIIPFMYFYFEEKDDDVTTRERMCSAVKYSIGFLIVASVLLLIGAFAPLKQPPKNVTEWDQKLLFLKDELASNKGETALSLMIGFLALIGMLIMIFYTAYGMTALPFAMLKGFKSSKKEHDGVNRKLEDNKERARMIRAKYMDGRSINGRDRRLLSRLEAEEQTLVRQERRLHNAQLGWLNKCLVCCRPFEVVFGVFYLLFAILLFVSLFITCLDKALHSEGYKYGYMLTKAQLPNPINIIMVHAQKVFPLDYCLFLAIVLYFIYASMAGMKRTGIRCCWIRLFKIRPRHTLPQALLLMCVMLMLIVLSLNMMLFSLAPQYVMYGSQHYLLHKNVTAHNVTTITSTSEVCSTKISSDDCTVTRIAVFLNRFFYKIWFFGACYYWGTWLFLLAFVIGLIVSIVRKRKTVVEEYLSDSDDSEEELIAA
ncbi:probable lysosomal cobalamin transporter [Exaiptasia diaphana]|uniref:Lysosomal cobalamin transporter n=1 Tax=Exaiptasia diaphana TaxID=2652724 RepID=A0A913X2M9_EXADI|nr:probable lysosomal cobalamin transporter [Exaiptasia diaphana]KXJ15975.1 putative lysosomal cobalamin transporter [Exaiptasia diaphana]